MYKATTFLAVALLILSTGSALAQETDYVLDVPLSDDFMAPYSVAGIHSAARGVTGPYDLDGDGLQEVLVTDYTGGGRVHVVENVGFDTWELVYSTPWNDSTSTTIYNARYAIGADMDNDDNGEIIFISGGGFSATNPGQFEEGYFFYEYTGTDNDYGETPAAILTLPETDRYRRGEQFGVEDVDGDGFQELLLSIDGSDGALDRWYVYSVTGDIGSGFEVFVEELVLTSRGNDPDPVSRGGGSPHANLPADLDGDGTFELSLHSFNSFNFTNVDVTGADTYVAPGEGAPNLFLQAAPADNVAIFGGVVIDINGDGDDEVFYPELQTGNVSVLNYEDGEDVLQITTDQLAYGVIDGLSTLGITAGDLDGDGNVELFGTGPHYGAAEIASQALPTYVRVAEFTGGVGGDPEDPANYEITTLNFFSPFDTMAVNVDHVTRDSAGVITEFLEETAFTGKDRAGRHAGQGEVFVPKLAFLGDADGDGFNELAVAFQGIDDSTYVMQETFNPADTSYTRVVVEARAVPTRAFMRIVSGGPDFTVDIEDERVVVPSDYVLSPNYPNPFNPSTSFTFTLPLDKRVSVRIYDMMGRLVRTLVNSEFYTAGTHQATWDGTSDAGVQVASGTYLYTLEHDGFRQSRTMILVK